MTWKLAKEGIFTASNNYRFDKIRLEGGAYIRVVNGSLTIGDSKGPIRYCQMMNQNGTNSTPSPELLEMVLDKERSKLSGPLAFPESTHFYRLFAQVDQESCELIGYVAEPEVWYQAELATAELMGNQHLKEQILANERKKISPWHIGLPQLLASKR